jgi:hypothetical protein
MNHSSICQVCGIRPVSGGNVRRVDGIDIQTDYCDACRHLVPTGHTAWAKIEPMPASKLGWVLLVLGILGAVFLLWLSL